MNREYLPCLPVAQLKKIDMTVPDDQNTDYELLLPSEDPGSARLKLPTDRDMGQEEQVLKPEGRRGDTIARYSALVSTSGRHLIALPAHTNVGAV